MNIFLYFSYCKNSEFGDPTLRKVLSTLVLVLLLVGCSSSSEERGAVGTATWMALTWTAAQSHCAYSDLRRGQKAGDVKWDQQSRAHIARRQARLSTHCGAALLSTVFDRAESIVNPTHVDGYKGRVDCFSDSDVKITIV